MKATDTEKRLLRWIEPEKPIRKQLERWACRRGQKWAVNLTILHACANVFTLQDSVSRAIYYTLLKCEVLQSEKFAMDLDKSIILAAYQLQIECPDFKPTLQDLKMLNLLPQSICRSPNMINNDDIYVRILNKYEELHTMQPAYVTLLYIVEIQQCDGYGEEAFPCKDGSSLEEVCLGYSLEWIFVRRPNGSTQKFRWEDVREIVANKRKMSIKYGDNLTNSVFCFEDNEMARYVSTVLTWKWRHARTDAQQQRSARLMSVQNLQGAMPSFSQPGSFVRRSNTNMNAIRPSVELNGGGVVGNFIGMIPPAGNGGPPTFLPSTPQMSLAGAAARTDHPASSSQSTVHSVQSCALRTAAPQTAANPASLSVCCRSVSLSQMPPNLGPPPIHRAPAERISPPGPTFYPSGIPIATIVPPPPLPPPPAPITVLQQRASNSSQDSDWLRNEQREVLKKMLTQKRRMNKIGSSPEINTLGKSVTGSGVKCKRHLINGGAAAAAAAAVLVPAAGTPNNGDGFLLARKIFTSTPNLHTTRQQQQQQQQTMPPPQTPTMAHSKMQKMPQPPPPSMFPSPPINHRLPPPFAFPFSAAVAAPAACPPYLPAYHPPLPPPQMNDINNGGSITATTTMAPSSIASNGSVGFYISPPQSAVPNGIVGKTAAPTVPEHYFSKGQMIDENGQQHTIIYPVPNNAAFLAIRQPQQQRQSLSPPSPPSTAAVLFPPPSTSPLANGGGMAPQQPPSMPMPSCEDNNSRSSPKSDAASSSADPLTTAHVCAVQSFNNGSTGTAAAAEQRILPEIVEIEFSGIPAKCLSADYSVAIRPHNLARNRGSKIYPYNENRVKLTGTKSNPDGYINASEVCIPVGSNRPQQQQCHMRYVVSQAPIQKTIEDFWRMVWETGARLIVMLVNPHQLNKDDTIPSYIPSQAKANFTVGEFFLRLQNVSPPMQMQFQSTTMFTLSRQRERRTIFHLYCADFAEGGVPSAMDTFIGLIDAVTSVKRHIANEAAAAVEANMATILDKEGGGGKTTATTNGTGNGELAAAQHNEQQQQQQQPAATVAEQQNSAVSKSNSNASKGSRSSSDISGGRDRTDTVESGGAWTRNKKKNKKLRFAPKQQHQQQQNGLPNGTGKTNGAIGTKHAAQNGGGLMAARTHAVTTGKCATAAEQPLAIIQCTDGASESGMFLLADVIIKCIENNAPFEIAQLLRDVRYQRMCVVKNAQQYKFIYDLVSFYERKNRLV